MIEANQAMQPDTDARHDESVILRSLPKVIFLYPTLIVSLVLGFLAWQWPAHDEAYATAFLGVAFLNFLVLAFDLPRTAMLTTVACVASLILSVILISLQFEDWLPRASHWALGLDATANDRFYWTFGIGLAIVLIVVIVVHQRGDYIQVTPMEVRHRLFLGDAETIRIDQIVKFGVEKPDMFEYLLLRAGRVWVQPVSGRTLVVEHVPRIDLREQQINHLLSHIDIRPVR